MNLSRLELVNFHRHSLIYCSNSLSIIRRFFCNWCCKNMTSKLIGKPSVWWSSHEESQRGQALFPNISVNVATGFLDTALRFIHRIKILHRKLSMNVNGNRLPHRSHQLHLNQQNVNGHDWTLIRFRMSIYFRPELGVLAGKCCWLITESKSFLRQCRRRGGGQLLALGLSSTLSYNSKPS